MHGYTLSLNLYGVKIISLNQEWLHVSTLTIKGELPKYEYVESLSYTSDQIMAPLCVAIHAH